MQYSIVLKAMFQFTGDLEEMQKFFDANLPNERIKVGVMEPVKWITLEGANNLAGFVQMNEYVLVTEADTFLICSDTFIRDAQLKRL